MFKCFNTLVAMLIIKKTQVCFKRREKCSNDFNCNNLVHALKFPMKDAPIRLEMWYTLPRGELISVLHRT